MGPYCKFCQMRCFVPMPKDTPDYILKAYGSSTIVATCRHGQAFEKQKTGYCYDDIKAAIAALEQARAEEREQCARIAMATFNPKQPEDADYDWGYNDAKRDIAAAIRNADLYDVEAARSGGQMIEDILNRPLVTERECERRIEQARAEERERCCAAMCRYCRLGVRIVKENGKWLHRNETDGGVVTTPCWAAAIRNAEEGSQ